MCLKQYVLDNRMWGSTGCMEALEEWQAILQNMDSVTEIVQTTTTTTTTNPSIALLQKQRFHCIFYLMNIFCLLALWIVSGILCASCLEDEVEDEPISTDDPAEKVQYSPPPLRTVLSTPKDDDPLVYIGVPLRIV